MSAKANFTQALKELTGFDEPIETKESQSSTFDSYVSNESSSSDVKASNSFDGEFEFSDGFRYEEPEYENTEITVDRQGGSHITSSMIIHGKVKAQCDVLIEGLVFGDVSVEGNLENKNLIIGDVKAANVAIDKARIKGNITVDGRAKIGENSTVVGNVSAEAITISSKIKGDLKASDIVVLEQDAIVVGDVVTNNFLSSPGANIKGLITTAASMNIDDDIEFDLGVEEYGQ
jgi:cytoskeletal protein CcmA (bactofilin family)